MPTVDRAGNVVDPDSPRFEDASLIAAAPVVQHLRKTPWPVQILGSGVDHDGTTPVMIVQEARTYQTLLDVFTVAGDDFPIAEATGQGRTRTVMGADPDLLSGAIPGKMYRPEAATACHGLIVVYCTVRFSDGQVWRDGAGAFVVSQDQGATWSLAFESDRFEIGWRRGAIWSMQNWWPTHRGEVPLEAFFVATDYCFNSGSPGASMFVMRATRTAVGEPWTIDAQGGATVLHTVNPNEHAHTGGIFPLGDHGLWAFTVIGDLREINRIVSMRRADDQYATPDWNTQDDFHGGAGNPGIEGNQFVGCAPGPLERTVIAGADLSAEQLMLLTFDPDSPDHPRTSHLYGLTSTEGAGSVSFIVRTPFPERGGPYSASASLLNESPLASRALYSPDGFHWCQAAQCPAFSCIHGDDIYYAALGLGIRRTPLPRTSLQKPLLIGPGGRQRTDTMPAFSSPGFQVSPLQRDAAGRWTDGGVPLSPQPPAVGTVYRVQTQRTDAPYLTQWLYPAGAGGMHRHVLGNGLQCRWWLYNPDPSRSGYLVMNVGTPSDPAQAFRATLTACTDRWFPVDVSGWIYADPDEPIGLRIVDGQVGEDQTVYLALDAVFEGQGTTGYATPTDPTVDHQGLAAPDELAAVTGLGCGNQWTVTFAAQVPEDGFDQLVALQHRWPIATLWSTDLNRIEIFADTGARRLAAEVYVGGQLRCRCGGGPVFWLRGSPILVSVAQPAGIGPLEITASTCGSPIANITANTGAESRVSPRELRFYSTSPFASSTGRGDRVSPLTVFGGRVDSNTFLSHAQRSDLLTSLEFLHAPPP